MPVRRRFCILTHSGGGQVNDLTPSRRLRWTRLLSLPCQIAGQPWRAAAVTSALRRLDSFSDLVPLYLRVSSFLTSVATSWILRPSYSHSPAVVFFLSFFFFWAIWEVLVSCRAELPLPRRRQRTRRQVSNAASDSHQLTSKQLPAVWLRTWRRFLMRRLS